MEGLRVCKHCTRDPAFNERHMCRVAVGVEPPVPSTACAASTVCGGPPAARERVRNLHVRG